VAGSGDVAYDDRNNSHRKHDCPALIGALRGNRILGGFFSWHGVTPHSPSGVFQTRVLIFPDVQTSVQHL
jgi:hypothetical protein